ncbi:putative glycosyltransferase [Novosphingobium sp. Rr 2-17]|uniref:glycosyltransferase family 4 protein n=1 Tax=Novosphingobium sp. Rr 2-17 TaxID=555793 RepID=UPI000269A213|nr:glycosyltransferase family 1 protein [Novosphingobium sp. Rr 2-17]EIZ78491.1 putative glycosyltransferase [Novosphingobium sp. Rr 2-17]
MQSTRPSAVSLHSASTPKADDRPFVFDASRLIWRAWRRRLPTGIDRVCLAYMAHFGARSLALLQWRQRRVVLRGKDSDALFALLGAGPEGFSPARLVRLLALAIPRALLAPPEVAGRIYLNIGHTGLNEPTLPPWLTAKRLRPVHLIHDLIPITHPQFCRPGEAERHTQRMRGALTGTSGIIVNSADTGAALAQFASDQRLPLPPVLVAHLGIEVLPTPPSPASPHPRPYFLSIGTIEGRKNHILLLHAWAHLHARLGERAPDLVLLGQRGWEAEETFALLDAPAPAHGQVIELAHCPDAELAAWIDHARAVLMPSRVEGYGLPVIEALARGTPVIAADLAVYREIAGDIPLLLSPDDAPAWAEAAARFTHDSPERQRQTAKIAHFAPPSWPEHFAQVEAWLPGLRGLRV